MYTFAVFWPECHLATATSHRQPERELPCALSSGFSSPSSRVRSHTYAAQGRTPSRTRARGISFLWTRAAVPFAQTLFNMQ